MSITRSESNFYKKNGYLVKDQLISKKDINKLNTLINKIVTKEKNSRRKVKDQGGTQSYDNYHFVFNSNSSKNKEILRLNNPQNNNKLFYDLSRNKKIIDIVKKLIGGTVRFHLGKLNFKLPNKKKGTLVEWHQDFAFYPHTNDDLVTVGIYLEDCHEKMHLGNLIRMLSWTDHGRGTRHDIRSSPHPLCSLAWRFGCLFLHPVFGRDVF